MSAAAKPHDEPDLEPMATPLHALMVEVRLLFHRLRTLNDQVHADDELTAGARGVLLSLHQQGPRTVPQLARSRPVSRQHIQALVNPLRERGLVELVDNPQHKRSRLVRLTRRGRGVVVRVLERERVALAGMSERIGARRLATATGVLREVRDLFDEPEGGDDEPDHP